MRILMNKKRVNERKILSVLKDKKKVELILHFTSGTLKSGIT